MCRDVATVLGFHTFIIVRFPGKSIRDKELSRSAVADRLLLFCDAPVPACTGFLAPGFCVEVDIAHTFPLQYSRCIFMYIKTTIKKPMDIKTIIKWAL